MISPKMGRLLQIASLTELKKLRRSPGGGSASVCSMVRLLLVTCGIDLDPIEVGSIEICNKLKSTGPGTVLAGRHRNRNGSQLRYESCNDLLQDVREGRNDLPQIVFFGIQMRIHHL